MERFTEEELMIAKSTDLCDVAAYLGYTVKRVGRFHTLKEMDSIRIYDRKSWFRYSREYDKGSNGGSQIDFLRVFAGMDIKEAVFWLLDFTGYKRAEGIIHSVAIPKTDLNTLKHISQDKEKEKAEFVLPIPAGSNAFLYAYLTEERCIRREVVDYFVENDLIYEARGYHNIVFKGNDVNGVTRFASMRGVFDQNGKGFKCDVAGNDKNFGFNVVSENSDELVVFESAIDLISYTDMYDDFDTNKLALGMLADAPLRTFLIEHPNIKKIKLCLDNDGPGRKATDKLMEKYKTLGYEVEDGHAPEQYKDYNEWLKSEKAWQEDRFIMNTP